MESCTGNRTYACDYNGFDCVDPTFTPWLVGLAIGYTGILGDAVNYKGMVSLKFNQTIPAPTATPSKTPTFAKPTVSPTSFLPTVAPSQGSTDIWLSFYTTVQIDNVDCTTLIGDLVAQDAAVYTTRTGMNPSIPNQDVSQYKLTCTGRRLAESPNLDHTYRRDGSTGSAPIQYKVYTDISALGYPDAQTAYNSLTASLGEFVSTGLYTLELQKTTASMGSDSFAAASVTTDPVFTDYTTDNGPSSSNSGSSPDNTGIIVGSVVGACAFLIIVILFWFFYFSRGNVNLKESSPHIDKKASSSSSDFHYSDTKVVGPAVESFSYVEANPLHSKGGADFGGL